MAPVASKKVATGDPRQTMAYLANVFPLSWVISRTYGVFHVPACPEGKPYVMIDIGPRPKVRDFGDKNQVVETEFAIDIAEDLARHCNSDAGDQSFLGVFLCGPEGPTDEELREANTRVDAFARRIVSRADQEWARSHSYIMIEDIQRRMAERLNLKREWLNVIEEVELCPGCGERVRKGVAVCKTCGAILDRAKAETLGLAEPRSEDPQEGEPRLSTNLSKRRQRPADATA